MATIIMIIYYFNNVCPSGDRCLAARYAEVLVAMAKGRIYAIAPPEEVLTERMVREVFGLASRIVADPVTGKPMMVPLGRHGACKRERRLSCEGVTQA
ncbi:ABC transporter ATP-binding protein [Halomonas caseinilytica]|uniref:ABC transporter ATP-binding protein n=1 Tax=Halomonas caseinilytica TaxID=438744 RepID=UPI002014A235|nr:ABC transporter ATP-binding protein [Halomonas caseinilytica]